MMQRPVAYNSLRVCFLFTFYKEVTICFTGNHTEASKTSEYVCRTFLAALAFTSE